MRSVKQFLLLVGMGALTLTPCVYGRSISGDSTAASRGAVQADVTFHRNVDPLPGFNGQSVFLNPESRAGGDLVFVGHLSLPAKPVVHVGHAISPVSDATNLFLTFPTTTTTTPTPSENSVTNGVASVPEGGTSASYLVPAAVVMLGGIFLTGWRRQRTPWQANS